MNKKYKYFGLFSILLGLGNFFFSLPFPDDMMALVNAMPPAWVSIVTSLLLPIVMIIGGSMLYLQKQSARHLLVLVFSWFFVIFLWGLVANLSSKYDLPFSIAVKSTITWGLVGGAVFYGVLAVYAAFFMSGGSQSNQSLNQIGANNAPPD